MMFMFSHHPAGGRYWKFNSKHFDGARRRAGLKDAVNWHSARATFDTRLHKLGVDKGDMSILMDHSQTITMHYVTPQVIYLHSVLQKLVGEIPDLRKIHAELKMNEATRRRELIDALSEESLNELCIQARLAREQLARRVSGANEIEVGFLKRDVEQLLELLQEFDDSRTEN